MKLPWFVQVRIYEKFEFRKLFKAGACILVRVVLYYAHEVLKGEAVIAG